jgi:two-component system response regulator
MDVQEVDILLVEDDPNDLELTTRVLNKLPWGRRVFAVRDGAEALDFLFGAGAYARRNLRYRPRMILLDLKLPKVGGIEVLRRIKSDERTRTIPTVILTSSREERDIVESYKLGVNSYVVKPVQFDQFEVAVSELGLYWMQVNLPA